MTKKKFGEFLLSRSAHWVKERESNNSVFLMNILCIVLTTAAVIYIIGSYQSLKGQ